MDRTDQLQPLAIGTGSRHNRTVPPGPRGVPMRLRLGDHHAGYYYNLTGHTPDPSFHRLLNTRTPYPTDWPSMASVVAYKRRPAHPHLPQAITLPHKEGAPEYTRPGQFAARLGLEYDPVFVEGTRERPHDFTDPALAVP